MVPWAGSFAAPRLAPARAKVWSGIESRLHVGACWGAPSLETRAKSPLCNAVPEGSLKRWGVGCLL
eukprot:14356198-Alexandrium_andersonii.AAC.1